MERHEQDKTLSTGQASAHLNPGKLGNSNYAAGDIIGGTYKIIDFLGQGGMGFVYRVEHLMLNKQLALKVLRGEQVNENIWRRFQTEAQAIARLDHNNIVKIYDMSQTVEGVPFYTMDLLQGESLADYLDREETVPLLQALPLFRQVCAGLAYAHDRGIIHRDIKPANIMLLAEPKGGIKIVDFGIAKLTFDGESSQGLTRPGEIFGSPLYMSPEQCTGSSLDHRTDIYSTGITFFQALTGRAPFIGRSAVETTAMHLSDQSPSLEEIGQTKYPQELELIISKMLEKSPEKRYQTLADCAQDLLLLETSLSQGRQRQGKYSFDKNRSDDDDSIDDEVSDDEDEYDYEHTQNNLKQSIKAAAKPTITVLAMVAALGFLAHQFVDDHAFGRHKPKTATSQSTASAIPAAKYQINVEEDALTKLNHEKDQIFDPEIGPDKPMFTKVIGSGAKAVRRFTLPKNINLGSIRYGPGRRLTQTASGTFDLPEHDERELIVNQEAAAHSKIFKRFQDGDLLGITCQATMGVPNDLIDNISHINSVTQLKIGKTEITNACVPSIAKLTHLQFLSVEETGITGDALAATPIPQRLYRLNFEKNFNASPLIQAMRNSSTAHYLIFSGTKITGKDIEALSTMSQISKLMLNQCPMTNEDLKPLVKLKKLHHLELRGCKKLNNGSLPTLSKLNTLYELKMSFFGWSEAEMMALHRAIPFCNIYNYEKRSWIYNRNPQAPPQV